MRFPKCPGPKPVLSFPSQTGVPVLTRIMCVLLALCMVAESKARWQTFTATAYAIDAKTATGKYTHEGRTVAADPAVLPLGTKIQVRGAGPYSGTYLVHDTGRKINGREIDIFMESAARAKRFGKKKVRVRILERAGSRLKSSR